MKRYGIRCEEELNKAVTNKSKEKTAFLFFQFSSRCKFAINLAKRTFVFSWFSIFCLWTLHTDGLAIHTIGSKKQWKNEAMFFSSGFRLVH